MIEKQTTPETPNTNPRPETPANLGARAAGAFVEGVPPGGTLTAGAEGDWKSPEAFGSGDTSWGQEAGQAGPDAPQQPASGESLGIPGPNGPRKPPVTDGVIGKR